MTYRIVVAGGGYAGLTAATRLAWQLGTDAVEITLVNAIDSFVERVRLHQLVAGQQLPAYPLSKFTARRNIRLRIGKITTIVPDRNLVELGDESLPYDTLIYAVGSMADTESVPGVRENAYTLDQLGPAHVAREQVSWIAAENGTIAVIGGGATGIEAATELAETYASARIHLLSDREPGWWLSTAARSHLRAAYSRLGITVRADAAVSSVNPSSLTLADGRTIAANLTLWTAGFRVPDMAFRAGFEVDRAGRVLVDDNLRSTSHPNVYAIGDAALARTPDGSPIRMGCGTGMPMSIHAADAITAELTGAAQRPLQFRYVAQNLSIGRRDGVIQILNRDDTPRRTILAGRVAAGLKERVVRATISAARHPLIDGGPRRRRPLYPTAVESRTGINTDSSYNR